MQCSRILFYFSKHIMKLNFLRTHKATGNFEMTGSKLKAEVHHNRIRRYVLESHMYSVVSANINRKGITGGRCLK
jgi:hypothetical protein